MTRSIRAALAVAAMSSLALAGPAFAFKFSPPSPPAYIVKGPVTLTISPAPPVTCNSKWHIHVTASGSAKILSATFTGGAGCSLISMVTPALGKPFSLTGFDMIVTLMSGSSSCGDFQPFNLSAGTVSFNNTFTGCSMSGSLPTFGASPVLTIIP